MPGSVAVGSPRSGSAGTTARQAHSTRFDGSPGQLAIGQSLSTTDNELDKHAAAAAADAAAAASAAVVGGGGIGGFPKAPATAPAGTFDGSPGQLAIGQSLSTTDNELDKHAAAAAADAAAAASAAVVGGGGIGGFPKAPATAPAAPAAVLPAAAIPPAAAAADRADQAAAATGSAGSLSPSPTP